MSKALLLRNLARNIFKSVLLVGLPLLMWQCGATYYTPSNQMAGQLTEEGEILATAGVGGANETDVVHYNAAYSPKNHLGIKFGGATFRESRDYNINQTFYNDRGLNGQLIEAAVGYYNKPVKAFAYDIYGGYGFFKGNTFDEDFLGSVDFNYNRYFVQPSIGVNTEFIDVILSLRFSAVNYSSLTAQIDLDSAQTAGQLDFDYRTFPLAGDWFYFIEPGFTIRLGYRQIKFEIQTALAFNYFANGLDYDPYTFGIGLVYNFKPSYSNKKNPLKGVFN